MVIYDALDLGKEIRNQADWQASQGYLAVAPDLFRGRSKLACMVGIMRDARDRKGPVFDDVEAARGWLLVNHSCIGVIGVCMAGGLTLILILAPAGDYVASSLNDGSASKQAQGSAQVSAETSQRPGE